MAAKYLTMVGQLQWLVILGRFDLHAQVATMSRFRAAPRQGHMDRLERFYSYAIGTRDYTIWFRTDQPDYSFLRQPHMVQSLLLQKQQQNRSWTLGRP